MQTLENELRYFGQHQDELRQKHPGQFVLIKGEEFIRAFPTTDEALSYAADRYGLQSVLIRHVDHKVDEVSIPALSLGILRGTRP